MSQGTEINRWLDRIKRAESVRNDADARYGYSRSLLEYQGDYASVMPSFVADTDIIPINEVYAYVKTFVPSVFSRNPHVAVNAKGKSHIASSKLIELALNAYWRDLRVKKEIKRCVFDACFAEGWLKTGYTAAFGSMTNEEGVPDLEASGFIQKDEIFAVRVPWKNMVRDPDAVDGIYDARFVAQKLIYPIEAVRQSSLYEKAGKIQPAIIASPNDPNQRNLKHSPADEVEYAILWEIWDMDSLKILTLSEGSDVWHMQKDWPYEFDGFPFSILRFNENPDECYSPNLIGPWEPQLWEKIKLRSMAMDHIKRYNRQLSIEEGAMTQNELNKLALGKTASITKRKKGTLPPAAIAYPPFQQDGFVLENRIDLDKDNISGQPNAVRSAPQRTQSRTLGEIDRLISSFQARQSEPQANVEDFVEDVAYKLIGLMKQYLPGEKFVRATQREFQEIAAAFPGRFDGTGFRFTREDIRKAEFEIEVKAGSTLPHDRQGRMESMIGLLKLGPTIGIQPGGKVSMTIGKNLVGEFDITEIEVAFEEEMARLEAMKKAAAAGQIMAIDAKQKQIAEAKESMMRLNGSVGTGSPVE